MSVPLTSDDSREKINRRCVIFLNLINHPPWEKRTILKRNGLCFIYFHKRHLASSCTLRNYSCNKCKGKNNISICIESKTQMIELIQGHQIKVMWQT